MRWRRRLDVSVRQYRPADAKAVWELHAALGGEGSRLADLVDVDATYLQPGGDFLVAEVGGTSAAKTGGEVGGTSAAKTGGELVCVVGTAALKPAEPGSTAAEVTRVLVRPDLRRRGIGTGLMDALHHRAAALGLDVVRFDIAHEQPEAVTFYHSLGYTDAPDEDTGRIRELVKRLLVLP